MKAFKPRKYDFTAEQLTQWLKDGLGWSGIARKFNCDHTTVMYAARRLGVTERPKLIGPDTPAAVANNRAPMRHFPWEAGRSK